VRKLGDRERLILQSNRRLRGFAEKGIVIRQPEAKRPLPSVVAYPEQVVEVAEA
jgi:hypothetical protein